MGETPKYRTLLDIAEAPLPANRTLVAGRQAKARVLRSQLVCFGNQLRGDVRVWTVQDDGTRTPTRCGLSVPVAALPELETLVHALAEEAKKPHEARAA